MIVSPCRFDDVRHLQTCLGILQSAVMLYKQTGDDALVEHIEYWDNECTALRRRIDSFDYKECDTARKELGTFLRRIISMRTQYETTSAAGLLS